MLTGIFGFAAGSCSAADSSQAQSAQTLPELARAASGEHQPVDDARIRASRTELRLAAQRLMQRLGGQGSFVQGWQDYLKWQLLEPHLSDDVAISGQSLRDLDSVIRRLRANKPGLEHPVFVRTAEALEKYRELAFWYALGQRRDTGPRYDALLLELEKQLTRNLERPTVESTRQIGKILGMLRHLGTSLQLVQEVSDTFDRPNVVALVSTTGLERLAKRPVSEVTPVRDVILGAQVRGWANSVGLLSLKTLPADDHIAVELQVAGNIQSRTNSYKKPVRVGSVGSTNFVATKHVQVSDALFRVMPATASARTRTQIRSITKTGGKFGKRLIEKIARKKVYESKGEAEWIAARHAERKIKTKFDAQVIEAVHQARQNYDSRLHPPLERLGMFPENLQMSSTPTDIHISATLAAENQISTDRLPTGLRTDNDLSLQIHETAANNLLPFMLGGARLYQDDQSEPPRIEGDVPDWLRKGMSDPEVKSQLQRAQQAQVEQAAAAPAEFRPWSFTFDSEHPVSVNFADQKFTLRLRVAELKTIEEGEESIRRNWDFLVTYRVQQEGNQVLLQREGEVQVLPTGFDPEWFGDPRWDDTLTAQQVAIRKNLEENINKRAAEGGGFPEQIEIPPVKLPTRGGAKQDLVLQQLDCDQGWLTLGYRVP